MISGAITIQSGPSMAGLGALASAEQAAGGFERLTLISFRRQLDSLGIGEGLSKARKLPDPGLDGTRACHLYSFQFPMTDVMASKGEAI